MEKVQQNLPCLLTDQEQFKTTQEMKVDVNHVQDVDLFHR